MVNSIIPQFSKFEKVFKDLFKLKKYIFIYLLFLIITIYFNFTPENYLAPIKELLIVLIAFILGIITIYYYNSEKSLHKVAFVIIILFGILSLFTVPFFNVPDEDEHYVRADLLSQGQFIPVYNDGFVISKVQKEFIDERIQTVKNNETGEFHFELEHYRTFFQSNLANTKINDYTEITSSAFVQNPFYGYIFQAFGILLAKLLDLGVVWTLWFGRFFNLLLYGAFSSYAIKKSPIFKKSLFIVACMPLAIYQGASISIDAPIFGLGLLIIAYFFKMFKSKDKSIVKKDIAIFSILTLLIGLMKLPLMAFILLLLVIPRSKFEKENDYYLTFLISFFLLIIALLWSNFYAVDALRMSWREGYFIQNNINASLQIENILNNPLTFLTAFSTIPMELLNFANTIFLPTEAKIDCNFIFMGYLYSIFFILTSLFYPYKSIITIFERFKALFVVLIIVFGTYLVQYITWSPLGALNIYGVSIRYFIPLFALIPFIFNINTNLKIKDLDLIVITLVIAFIGSFISMIGIFYY